ncbi:hypothetical protein [Kribbella sp. VKM Ac-2568]|uniref:hypothetical protein n=1 Tax=Kribbella sp. VKM Ac-2568 TaxID=2512219 RepID=UPI00104D5543|nr:hypothetical protein [Kribbella sp. VKM Ac-2568]TCM46872.1 hypothetical protein EV648_105350 [Kribbella sp. VKM Ac-2568]
MVDRDLIVERLPFHDEIAECSELEPSQLLTSLAFVGHLSLKMRRSAYIDMVVAAGVRIRRLPSARGLGSAKT